MGHYSWLGMERILMNYVDFTGVTVQINPNQLLIVVIIPAFDDNMLF